MGGIFVAYPISENMNAVSMVIEGLLRLRHRGNQGVGIAFLDKDMVLHVEKRPVDVRSAIESGAFAGLHGVAAMGQVRAPTHGRPTIENTHPHLDCSGRIAVVGDGIVEGYSRLYLRLSEAHDIMSRNDFELVAHVLEEKMELSDPLRALMGLVRELPGYYSVAVMVSGVPEVYVASRGPRVAVGVGGAGSFAASVPAALHGLATDFIELGKGEVAVLREDDIEVYDAYTGRRVIRGFEPLNVDPELIDKAGFQHYMLKEIYEIPEALYRSSIVLQEKYLELAARVLRDSRSLFIIGNGSCLNASYVAAYYLSELAGKTPVVVSAAEFPYYSLKRVTTGTVVIAISQSGESEEVLESVKEARRRGAVVVGVTNTLGSTLARQSNVYLPVGVGPELAVPATKTFVGTLVVLLSLAYKVGEMEGVVDPGDHVKAMYEVQRLAENTAMMMSNMEKDCAKAASILGREFAGFVSSRGVNYPVALEGALKLKEVACIHAEGVETGELRHGPQSLIEEGLPVIMVMPSEERASKHTKRVVESLSELGATLITVCNDPDDLEEVKDKSRVAILSPPTEDVLLTPVMNVIPLFLVAYHTGLARGTPIDAPRSLVRALVRQLEPRPIKRQAIS